MSDFDKDFPGEVSAELDRRATFVETKSIEWNYDKYCWVNMKATGNSTTVFCSIEGNQVGDPGIRTGHLDLYEEEGGVRKFKPQLKSVKITNQGAQDYADSFIYEVEASFTLYTMAQLEEFDASYFRVGAEVEFNFGWEGYTDTTNRGTVTANVYNFGFTLADDGSFDCNIKCMSAAGLWSSDDMGGITKDKEGDDDSEEDPYADFIKELQKGFRRAFDLDDDEGPDSIDDLGNNKLRYASKAGLDYGTGHFFAGEIVTAPGWFNDDETYVGYTNIDTLVRYLNYKAKGSDSIYTYEVGTGDIGTFPKINAIGCADPRKFVLPGKQGNYGDPNNDSLGDGDYALNFSKWGNQIEAADAPSDVGKIAVSIQYMNQVYKDLSAKAGYKSGVKLNPKVTEFVKTVFGELESLTGGLISLNLIPLDSSGEVLTPNQTISTGNPIKLVLGNKKMISNATKAKVPTPYEFEVLGKRSITRSVSLDSDFDTDLMIAATPQNVKKGTSNMGPLASGDGPYKICPPISKDEQGVDEGSQPPTLKEIEDTRLQYGNGGFDDAKVQSYAELCRNYILRESRSDGKLKAGRYGEIQFVLNLSVTIDGVWGIPYLAPIIIDRIPSNYKQNCIFSITGVEHTFDGQGDWETNINTVMRMV